jgi:hypothetical protein
MKYKVITTDGREIEVSGEGVQLDPNTQALIVLSDSGTKKAAAVFSRGSWSHVIAPEPNRAPAGPFAMRGSTRHIDWARVATVIRDGADPLETILRAVREVTN